VAGVVAVANDIEVRLPIFNQKRAGGRFVSRQCAAPRALEGVMIGWRVADEKRAPNGPATQEGASYRPRTSSAARRHSADTRAGPAGAGFRSDSTIAEMKENQAAEELRQAAANGNILLLLNRQG
jgi:hypothetical protein